MSPIWAGISFLVGMILAGAFLNKYFKEMLRLSADYNKLRMEELDFYYRELIKSLAQQTEYSKTTGEINPKGHE